VSLTHNGKTYEVIYSKRGYGRSATFTAHLMENGKTKTVCGHITTARWTRKWHHFDEVRDCRRCASRVRAT